MSMRERSTNAQTGREGPADDELAQLINDIEADPEVRMSLEQVPQPPRLRAEASGLPREDSRERIPSVNAGRAGVVPMVVYRDRDDIRTILNLTSLVMIMSVLLVALVAGNIYQYYRRPDRIVVDGGSGRVLSINDRNYGKEDGVEFGPDRLTSQDKLYISREFLKALYQVDPATRPKDIERALTMMVPDSALTLAKWLREKGILDQQQKESWQTIWSPMDVSVDRNDPYTVIAIGRQDITKVVNGVVVKESKQLRLTIKLVADGKGRADRNIRSGFLISSIDYSELNDRGPSTTAPEGASAPGSAPAQGNSSPVSVLDQR